MSNYIAFRHAQWLPLVEPSGSFTTIPVLKRVFPNGLDRTESELVAAFRDRLPDDFSDLAASTVWVEWVLAVFLEWGTRLRSGPKIPETMTYYVGEHNELLRPDFVLVEPGDTKDTVRALVCQWPHKTVLDKKLPGDRWSATPLERAAQLCRATGVGLCLVTNGEQWSVVWAPVDGVAGGATFLTSLFTEVPALRDAFRSLLCAKRFFSVQAGDTIEALLVESAAAQEVVADRLGKQVRAATELLVSSISRANRDRDGDLLVEVDETEIYNGTVTVLMRLVFLLFAEERGLLPLDDELYARSYALCTLREQLQSERDLHGEEPLERRSAAWYRILALFRAVHSGLNHDTLRIPPYGGRLFDPDRFAFLEGRRPGTSWRDGSAEPIAVDDLTMLAVLDCLQVLQFSEGGIREARQLSYRTLEVEQIGHVYEGLLDHSVRKVTRTTLGLVGKEGDEPEVVLEDLESAKAGGRDAYVAWLKSTTGLTENKILKLLESPAGDNDRQLLAAAVDNDEGTTDRILPHVHLLRRDLRDLPIVMLEGSIYVTQTSARRDGGIEYTTKDLADEVATHTLEPLVYSPGPQDNADASTWKLRPSVELLDLKICDPAVGSGSILVAAGRYLADRVVEAWVSEEAEEAVGNPEDVRLIARRAVVDRCLYGVDRDPLAAEMAKLSLWLVTMAKDRPFSFVDHAIRVGDGLLGVTNLDQVRCMHLDPAAGQRLHRTLFDYTAFLEPLVKDALDCRQQLAKIRVISIRDAEDKARLMRQAEADLDTLRVIADLVVGASLSTASQKNSALNDRLVVVAERVANALANSAGDADTARASFEKLRDLASGWLNAGRPDDAPLRRCLHWPLEFPEVFLDREHPGFHFVGNPPFVGGSKITGSMGTDFRDHLVAWIAAGKNGKADLVAYFFLRATQVGTSFGFLATNTIAQGGTSEVGLRQILNGGWSIHRAVSSIPWPGRASLEISKVWATADIWTAPCVLDGVEVAGVDEMLYPASRSGWHKERLAANRDRSFEGSKLYGMGFTMSPEEAAALIEKDRRNAEVLFPYLGGQDLNTSPTQTAPRWTINFFDWEKSRAETYPDCFAIVEENVKPQRQERKPNGEFKCRKPLPERYWIYAEKAPKLYEGIAPLKRVLAFTLTSKTVLPVFVDYQPQRQVFGHSMHVFPYPDDYHFGLLTSGFHYRWAVRNASTMRTDIRYTPSDCFETFPQPEVNQAVADAGKALNEHRADLMVAADEGLTATYNRVHNPADTTPKIQQLRELHLTLDLAVRDAYGWSDLDLEHGFHTVRGQGIRYTFSPAAAVEVLERLLELNKERYEAEVANGMHGSAKKQATKPKKKAYAPEAVAPTMFSAATYETNEGP